CVERASFFAAAIVPPLSWLLTVEAISGSGRDGPFPQLTKVTIRPSTSKRLPSGNCNSPSRWRTLASRTVFVKEAQCRISHEAHCPILLAVLVEMIGDVTE